MDIGLQDNLFFLNSYDSNVELNGKFIEEQYNFSNIKKDRYNIYFTKTVEYFKHKDRYEILFFSKSKYDIRKLFENLSFIDISVCKELFNSLLYKVDYAIIIIDKVENKIYSFRTPNGVVPMYYFYKDGTLVMSMHVHSIAKAIKKVEISDFAIEQMYVMDCLMEPYTLYEGVYEIGRTYIYEFDLNNNSLKKEKAYSFKYEINNNISLEESIATLKNEIIKSHQKRVGSINGIMLSGGIDSNVMCYALKNCTTSSLESFNVSVKNQKNSEAPYAKKVADYFGLKHREVLIDPSDINEKILEDIVNLNFPYWGVMYIGSIFKSLKLKEYNVFTGQDTRLHTPYVNILDDIIFKNKINSKAVPFLGKKLAALKFNKKVTRALERCRDAEHMEKYLIKYFLHCFIDNNNVNSMLEQEIKENIEYENLSYQELFNEITWLRWGQQYTDDIKYMDSLCNHYYNTCQFPFYDIKLAEVSASIPFKYSNKRYIGKSGFGNGFTINNKYLLMRMLKDENVPINLAGRKKAVSSTIHLYFNDQFGKIVKDRLNGSTLLNNPAVINLGLDKLISQFCSEDRIYGDMDYSYLIKIYNIFVLDVLKSYIK